MAVTDNTTLTSDITVNVKELDLVTRFETNWQALIDIMGISRPIRKTAGTKLVSSKTTVTLDVGEGTVTEGDEVPLSKVEIAPVTIKDIALKFYRKRITAQDVDKFGPEIAVQKTDDALLNEITGKILKEFYTFAETGGLAGTAKTFQEGIATAIYSVMNKFQSMHLGYDNIVAFMNTLDVGKYLGTEATISLQTANGMTYLKNFMGASTVIVSNEITAGTILATPADNICLYYIDPTDYLSSLELRYTTSNSPTRLLGVHREGVYGRASRDLHAIYGMSLFAEYLDGIAKVTVSPGE